jgi:hypothetical protein
VANLAVRSREISVSTLDRRGGSREEWSLQAPTATIANAIRSVIKLS